MENLKYEFSSQEDFNLFLNFMERYNSNNNNFKTSLENFTKEVVDNVECHIGYCCGGEYVEKEFNIKYVWDELEEV